ncbi:MAG: PAS domain-containing protein [Candidatus Sericytochromatia bacterium]|nr:PAS domain-containing protein [Candidatus Sericytochromatia bacterium]
MDPEPLAVEASPVFERIHPEDLPRVRESIVLSAQHLSTWNCEYRVTLPDLGERWLMGGSEPERLPDGSTLWHGYLVDITDKHQLTDARCCMRNGFVWPSSRPASVPLRLICAPGSI